MRIIAPFAFLVIILFPAYGQINNYEVSAGAQFGFVHGQSLELVYPIPNDTKGELLSELKWDMKPVFYYGINIDFEKIDLLSSPGFFISASFKAGIPAVSGTMEDRDWQSEESDALTNFSSHDNKTQRLFMADLITGASIPIKSLLYIKPFISGSWMHFYFSGRDGYGKYASRNWETIEFNGEVITYRQDWFLFATGFSIGTEILRPFTFDLSFKISPLTYCNATDEHLIRSMTFKDFTSFGLYLEPACSVSLNIKRFELSLEFAYRYIGRTRGKSYIKGENTGKYFISENDAGAGLSILDTRFLVIFHF